MQPAAARKTSEAEDKDGHRIKNADSDQERRKAHDPKDGGDFLGRTVMHAFFSRWPRAGFLPVPLRASVGVRETKSRIRSANIVQATPAGTARAAGG